jgi:hypothetical protein
VIRVYDAVGNVIETHEHKGDFKEWWRYRVKQKAAMQWSTTAHCFGWLTGLAIIQDGLRCRFVQFKLCVHFLNLPVQVSKGSKFQTLGCKIPLGQGVGDGLGDGCWNSKFLMTTSTSFPSVGPAWGANGGKW